MGHELVPRVFHKKIVSSSCRYVLVTLPPLQAHERQQEFFEILYCIYFQSEISCII